MRGEDTNGSGQREQLDRLLFDRIALRHSRKDEAASSRVARRHRLEATIGLVQSPAPFEVLEVGCGAGYAYDYLAPNVGRYVGVDHSQELIHVARSRWSAGPTFLEARVQDLDFEDEFDVVLVVGVLHHLESVDDALSSMVRSLRRGGHLVVNEPQPDNPVVRVARRARKRIDRTYSTEQVEFSAAQLRAMFVEHGLVSVDTQPQGYLSTPFAEVPLGLPGLTARLSRAAVWVDRRLGGRRFWPGLAWNCVAVGRKP